jgi:CofH/MqnC C-terminal region
MIDIDINSAIASRAMGGATLTPAELEELDGVDVLSLGILADDVRRSRVGGTVSYSRVIEVGAAGLPAAEELATLLPLCGEVRMVSLGDALESTAGEVRDVRAVVGPAMRLTGFSLADLLVRAWAPLADVLAALKAAGLDAIAEAPIDLVTPADVAAVRGAGLAVRALTVQRPGEEGRVALITRVRAFLDGGSTPTPFAPLPREQSVTAPTTGYHDVRVVALARIGLPSVATIEVDWQQYGPKLAQVALTFGANHLDRVSLVDDPALGRRRSNLEDVRRNIAAAGFTAVEQGSAV